MKTQLILAVSVALALSAGTAVAQSTDAGGTYQQKTTTTTTTTTRHIDAADAAWYKQGGVVPVQYREGDYVVTEWKTAKLTQPTVGHHWIRGANGDFLLLNDANGAIVSIVSASQ